MGHNSVRLVKLTASRKNSLGQIETHAETKPETETSMATRNPKSFHLWCGTSICFKLQIGQNLVFADFLWFQVQPAATLSFSFFFRGVHSRHVAALHWVGPMPEIHRAFAMRSKSRAASGTTKMSADEVG